MLANVYYYRREANNRNTLEKYAVDLPFDRLDEVLFRWDPGLRSDGRGPVTCHGPRSQSRDPRGRVSGDQRRRPHLRLQELRGRLDQPQAAGADHLRGRPAQHLPRPACICRALCLPGRVRPVDPAWPVIRPLENLRLAEILTKVGEAGRITAAASPGPS